MTNTTTAAMKNDAESTGLPHSNYDGMDWGHFLLVDRLLYATSGAILAENWPGEAGEAARRKALQLVGDTRLAFGKFTERFSPLGVDGDLSPELEQGIERAEAWSGKVFLSLPATEG